VDGQDGVARVVLVIEEGPQLGLREVLFEPRDGGRGLRFDVLALGGELGQDLELLLLGQDPSEELDVLLQELFLLLEGLGGLLVLPDLGRGQPDVNRIPLGVLVIEVKENLGPLRSWRRGR
jgi:hypothetical protein